MNDLIQRILENSDFMEPRPAGIAPRLTVLPGVRVVLFDIYGTLFVSGSGDIGVLQEARSGGALQDALTAAGFAQVSEDAGARGGDLLLELIRASHAHSKTKGVKYPEVDIQAIWHGVAARLEEEGLIDGVVNASVIDRLAVEYECRANPCWPMPALASTLMEVRDRVSQMGIVSNAQFYTPLLFEAFLKAVPVDLGFDPKLCVYSYELMEAKPSRRLFREVFSELDDIKPEQVVYVGNDMLNDIWPASEAGFRTVLFAGDQRSLRLREGDVRCADVQPDAVITELPQLVEILYG